MSDPGDPVSDHDALTHLDPLAEATPEDHAAFEVYIHGWAVQISTWLPLFFVGCVAAWWPLDRLVAPDEAYVAAFRDMRVSAALLLLLATAAFRTSAWARDHVFGLGVAVYIATLSLVGFSVGRLGPGQIAWLADAFIAVVPVAMFPMSLARRILATVTASLALPLAWLLASPDNVTAPTARGQITFALFVAAMSVVMGEVMLRTIRRSFLLARAFARERGQVTALADALAARVAEQADLLQAQAWHLGALQEAEKLRLSRELHDELGQTLHQMRYLLESAHRRLDAGPEAAPDLLAALSDALQRTTRSVRQVLGELRPRTLEEEGLAEAVRRVAARARGAGLEVVCALDADVDEALSEPARLALFRCIQEATTNVQRHARATRLFIAMRRSDAAVEVRVEDDGIGVDPSEPTDGYGLIGMRERIRAVGGTLRVAPGPRAGTHVVATVPILEG